MVLTLLLVLAAFIITSAAAQPGDPADFAAVDAASISLDGPIQAVPGEIISYDIITDAAGLFGAQLELKFDPLVLQVIGTQVTPGSCPIPDFVASNSVDNSAGTIAYAVTSLAPTLPCDGGIVASFQFQVAPTAVDGSTQLQFENVILADANGSEIPGTAVDLNLEIVAGINAAFSGTPTSGTAPLTVNFSNLSSGAYDTCAWTFGDSGTSSTCASQSHVYNNPGVYTVELTVSGLSGSDSETKTDYIVVSEYYWVSIPVIIR